MPSDRARATYDANQKYQSVVMQQGRVLLEADWNEAQEIAAEQLRAETREIVGPSGTPDDGYRVFIDTSTPNVLLRGGGTTHNVTIGGGTMYVGGVRVTFPQFHPREPGDLFGTPYSQQPDWSDPPIVDRTAQLEIVWLEIFEQEISAVEDPALRDPALGGRDTAQRTRIMQRIHRTKTSSDKCAAAFAELQQKWSAEGWTYDGVTKRLQTNAALAVQFHHDPAAATPCDPVSQSGFLGSENQFIRVAIAGGGDFVWGFDDASFLYPVKENVAGTGKLILASHPVDNEHRPRADQFVELLRGTARLSNGAMAAEPFGPIVSIGHGYDPNDNSIVLSAPLPTGYDPTSRPLYVRIWEQRLSIAPPPVALGNTGVKVTVGANATTPQGDFWTFALRPSTPTVIYPSRYSEASQPPEGFRRWACPLGVIDWTTGSVDDCRETFENLVALTKRRGGCCITLRPEDLKTQTLQQIIDAAPPNSRFCLKRGEYPLQEPLVLSQDHGTITIEGCGSGVLIRPAAPRFAALFPGLVQLLGTTGATLRRLEFEPGVPPRIITSNPFITGQIPGGVAEITRFDDRFHVSHELGIAVSLRIVNAEDCTVEECTFRFPAFPQSFPENAELCGAAILANGNLFQVSFRRNRIIGDPGHDTELAGIVATQAIFSDGTNTRLLPCSVDLLSIENNELSGLARAIWICADLQTVDVRENTITDCTHGIALISSRWFGPIAAVDNASIANDVATALTQAAGRIRSTLHDSDAAISALGLATLSAFHPSIAIPLGAYAMFPFPAGFVTGNVVQNGTPLSNGLLINIAEPHVRQMQPFAFQKFGENEITNELNRAWQTPHPLQPLTDGMLRTLNLTPVFNIPVVHATIDMSHNRVTRRVGTTRPDGIALLTIADDGARPAQGTPGSSGSSVPVSPPPASTLRDTAGGFPIGGLPIVNPPSIPVSIFNSTVASANDLRNSNNFFPTAAMLFDRYCSVTGNLVQNQATSSDTRFVPSLLLIPLSVLLSIDINTTASTTGVESALNPASTARTAVAISNPSNGLLPTTPSTIPLIGTAVTGNVFVGWPVLPLHTNRRFTAPPWWDLNQIVE